MDIDIKDKEYLTVEEVSELLSVHVETIRRKIRSKELKAVLRLNRYYITREAINEYMKESENGE